MGVFYEYRCSYKKVYCHPKGGFFLSLLGNNEQKKKNILYYVISDIMGGYLIQQYN